MNITGVKVTLPSPHETDQRLLAFCEIELDSEFVIRELRYILGDGGRAFVAMPSRKQAVHCRSCDTKNKIDACFCNQCGIEEPGRGKTSPERHFHDVALPITSACRQQVEMAVMLAYKQALEANGNGHTSQ